MEAGAFPAQEGTVVALNSYLLNHIPCPSDKSLEWLLIKEESSEMAKNRYNRIRTQ